MNVFVLHATEPHRNMEIGKLGKCRKGFVKLKNKLRSLDFDFFLNKKLGTGGVQGQVKGQRLMGIKAVNDSIGLATCQSKIYEK